MSELSPHQTLLNAYPGKLTSNDGSRIRVVTIRGTEVADDLDHIQERLADIISDLDQEFYDYIERADEQQEAAANPSSDDEESTPSADDGQGELPEAIRRNAGQSTRDSTPDTTVTDRDFDYSSADIELAELTDHSEVIGVPYPRGYRCTECDRYAVFPPDAVRDGPSCPVHDRQMERFPFVFVCPRCAHYEQASPHEALQDESRPQPQEIVEDSMDRYWGPTCPVSDCDEELRARLGDRLRATFFTCGNGHEHDLYGRCPQCHRPATDGHDEVVSEMRPKAIDASSTDPMILDDIQSNRGTTLDELRAAHEADQADGDTYNWDLDLLSETSAETIRSNFGVRDVFTVADVNTVTACYGYQATVTARGTDLDEQGRLTRTFRSSSRQRRAFLTRREGRAVVFDIDTDLLTEVLDVDAGYESLAATELDILEQCTPDEIAEGTDLELIPLLHAYQHGLYRAAIEEAGLEDFLAAKILVESGAIVLAERRHVGSGGLSQLTLNKTGATLLDVFQRAEDILKNCNRNCTDACLSCVFLEDANCHPFVSREVDGYIPANSLLDRELASEVIRYA